MGTGLMTKFDAVDLKILRALQKDATISSSQIADVVGMSQSPTWRRIANLEETGAIRRRVALIDREAIGLTLMVHVLIRLKDQSQSTVDTFRTQVLAIPEIVQCHMLMGDIDFLLLVIAENLPAYHRLLRNKLSRIPGVSGIDSRAVIEETKGTTELPMDSLIKNAKARDN
jgi:Lrp/AsnC family transcriptional regulator